MHEKFSPSEMIETQERKEKHEKGKEEAQYYHIFLESLKLKILKRVEIDFSEKAKESEDKYSLGSYLSSEELTSYIEDAKKDAKSGATIMPKGEFVQVGALRNMSPRGVVEYLDKLDSSLIK